MCDKGRRGCEGDTKCRYAFNKKLLKCWADADVWIY